jgi:ferredoxin
MSISKRVVLHFPRNLVDRPIVVRLVRDFNLSFNILKASVTPNEEGLLVMELMGEEADYYDGFKYLTEAGVTIEPLSKTVMRDEAKCVHCGACTALCPGDALEMESATRLVQFHDDRCLACGLCIRACPLRAMEMKF